MDVDSYPDVVVRVGYLLARIGVYCSEPALKAIFNVADASKVFDIHTLFSAMLIGSSNIKPLQDNDRLQMIEEE